ncbi:hypothetical protein BKH41_02970 [Helicobacter sp. 12S02232-10]|uniref:RCC1 domain-containing protein n=1 Tax=Helicobacter sp. 12S02232-10 TaxID=1476197 RepID=UPI000BA6B407|nr:hypothetical protein [Helicobacter sp. 12S02232-10]PAF49068.1 hypothetical protein BKH41_02970 [Helicobacter sp. 12S02232-10]
MNENDILDKLEALKALKSMDLKEEFKARETYMVALKEEFEKKMSKNTLFYLKKQIRLLKNVNMYRGVMVQKVITSFDASKIIRYGDIFVSGGDTNTSGSGRAWAGFSRLAIPQGVEIIDVVGGHANFFAIEKNSDSMWVWGNNSQGCLGVGHNSPVPVPQRVTMPSKIKQVCSKSYSSGYQFCTILLEDGSVWSCGRNTEGELGIGNTLDCNRFIKIYSLSDIEEIWGGNNFVSGVFARQGKKTYAWGWNGNGCLGLGKATNALTPEELPLKNITKVYHYTADRGGWKGLTFFEVDAKTYIDGRGSLWACGFSGARENSKDILNDVLNPVQIFSAGVGGEMGEYKYTQFVSSGVYGTCLFLNATQNVWAWGYGDFGFGDERSGTSLGKTLRTDVSFKSILTKPYAYASFFAQDTNGTLWSFGYNNNALGQGHNNNIRSWARIPTPNHIIDYDLCSYYEGERVLIATDGCCLYACGTSNGGNINYTTNLLQPQILPLEEK